MVDRLVRTLIVSQALGPLAALVTVTMFGAGGFMTLTGVGVVEALFWLVDLTSLELYILEHPDAPATLLRGYGIATTLGLIVSSVWLGETVLTTAFGDNIKEELRHVSTKRRITDLDGHVVVCGYGALGSTLAEGLLTDGREVVVIESDADRLDAIPPDALSVQGDARLEAVLREAGVERADTVVAAVDDSNVNVQTTITASELAPDDARIVVRVGDESYIDMAQRAGANRVVVPEVESAANLTQNM